MGLSSIDFSGGASVERRLTGIIAEALGSDFELVNVTMAGRKVILRGTAPSYAAKARAAECLRRAGYAEVENCLRVVPGIPSPAGGAAVRGP